MAGRKRTNKKKDDKKVDEKNKEVINESESNKEETQENIEYDIKKAGKFLLKAFEGSEEFKEVTNSETRAIQYDKWRKKSREG